MKRIQEVDPAIWIGLFFGVLIAVNVLFYIIAFNQPNDYIPPEELANTAAEAKKAP